MTVEPRLPATVTRAIKQAKLPFEKIARKGGDLVVWERESMFAIQAIGRSSLLQKCDSRSIRDAIINASAVGLSLNPTLQHAALVPRYDSKLRTYMCDLEPMYQGLIGIACDGDQVLSVRADVVRERDQEDGNFKYFSGTDPKIIHTPDPFMEDRGPIVGAYCVAELKGTDKPHVTFMRRSDLDKAREMSEAYKSWVKKNKPQDKLPGWVVWEEEYCKKTVIKRAQKTWPKGTGRLERAVALSNIAEGYIVPQPHDIPGVAIELISPEQAKELRDLARDAKLRVERIYKVFRIQKMEELAKDDYTKCRERIRHAKLVGILKNATKDEPVIVLADEWGMTLTELTDLGAEVKTEAKLYSSKKTYEETTNG